MSQGYLSADWWCSCACCGKQDWIDAHTTSSATAARAARKLGWRLTHERGWICPECIAKYGTLNSAKAEVLRRRGRIQPKGRMRL